MRLPEGHRFNQIKFWENSLEDGEDGADGDKAVNVGASIKGVEGDDVLALPLSLNLNLILIFL